MTSGGSVKRVSTHEATSRRWTCSVTSIAGVHDTKSQSFAAKAPIFIFSSSIPPWMSGRLDSHSKSLVRRNVWTGIWRSVVHSRPSCLIGHASSSTSAGFTVRELPRSLL